MTSSKLCRQFLNLIVELQNDKGSLEVFNLGSLRPRRSFSRLDVVDVYPPNVGCDNIEAIIIGKTKLAFCVNWLGIIVFGKIRRNCHL